MAGGSSALAAMELSRFLRDKTSRPSSKTSAFRISHIQFIIPFACSYHSRLSFWSTIGNCLLLLPDSARGGCGKFRKEFWLKGASAWMDREPASATSLNYVVHV